MIDRMLNGSAEVHLPAYAGNASNFDGKKFRRELTSAEIFVADNVAEYLYAGTDQEEWDLGKDFPNLAPPFPLFWIEHRRPSKIISREYGERDAKAIPRNVGLLFHAMERDEAVAVATKNLDKSRDRLMLAAYFAAEKWGDLFKRKIEQHQGDLAAIMADLTPEQAAAFNQFQMGVEARRGVSFDEIYPAECRWVAQASAFVETAKDLVVGPLVNWVFVLDGQGRVLREPRPYIQGGPIDDPSVLPPQDEISRTNQLAFVPALTISFLHCKNVKLIPDSPEPKLAKAYQKRHGRPLVRFHTLEIEPMKQTLRREGRSAQTGLRRALHICRGHFADYTEGRGLFGKHHGTYWIDSHVRGRVTEGVVVKDYSVDRPSDRPQTDGV
jgi:hypothetical protein